MAQFKPFRSFQKSLTRVEIKPARKKTYSRSTSTSFLSAFSTVSRTVRRYPVLQAQRITSYLPQTRTLDLSKDIKLEVPNLTQWDNECGPTSLAMVMQYFGIDPGDYHNMFGSDTVGHGPLALKSKAQAKGLVVRQENYGDLEDLAAMIDKGIPPMVLGIYGGGSNSTLSDYIDNASRAHWMVVTGYKRDESGQITDIYFNNPNRSYTQCWSASDFLNKFWNNNIIPGGHRYYMGMAKAGSFAANLLTSYLPNDKISSYYSDMLNIIGGLENAFYTAEDIAGDIVDAVGDAAQEVVDFVEDAADTVADAANDVWGTVSGWFS